MTHNEVARRIKGPKHEEALKLAKEATDLEEVATYIRRYREIVNFVYWRLRAQVEQTDEMLTARSSSTRAIKSMPKPRWKTPATPTAKASNSGAKCSIRTPR